MTKCQLTEGTIAHDVNLVVVSFLYCLFLQFDLRSDRAWLVHLSTSAYAVGSMLGAVVLTRLADV